MLQPLSNKVGKRLMAAAQRLGTADPVAPISGLISRTFSLPEGDPRYGENALTPMAAPFEPSFSEQQPGMLRFTIEPLGPGATGIDRRDEATREMRRLVASYFGRDALHWFDQRSEAWRGFGSGGNGLGYGAFFGANYDRDGLAGSKVYYETGAGQIDALPGGLLAIVRAVTMLMPGLRPLFTTIATARHGGGQRLTFVAPQALRIADFQPVLDALGLGERMPAIMQMLGLCLGGRFDLPANSCLVAFGQTETGPEFEIYVMLGMIPDLPPDFLSLLTLGLNERPRELQALERWMDAFTPDDDVWPGRFSIISIHTSRSKAPRVSLYLRPAEFEVPLAAMRRAN